MLVVVLIIETRRWKVIFLACPFFWTVSPSFKRITGPEKISITFHIYLRPLVN
jgi:hypothetical protein